MGSLLPNTRRSSLFAPLLSIILFCCLIGLTSASSSLEIRHEHHDEDVGPYEQNFTNDEEIDTVLKWHIGIQMFCWGLLFPLGMILGLVRSRFHAPLQALGCILTLLPGNFLGHHHGGRSFHSTAHSHFASYMWWYLVLQTGFGVFLKLHVMEGTRVRRAVVLAHGVVGKSFPVVGWVQMIFGGIAALGFCFGEHFGQCLAHFIMGSAFIGYAVILLIMLRLGAGWLARRKCSQEYIDSWVIMVWGIVNTFTEHDFFRKSNHWSHKDMQHVSLGVLWWAGGALGIFLGRHGKRNVVPGVIIAMTGYAMSAHAQSLEFSTTIHKLFGFSLMAAGSARVIEICFVLNDSPSPSPSSSTPTRAFQHLPPYLLVLSGLTFLSATEEQMQWVAGSGMDATTYANILFSGAFVIYLVAVALVEGYEWGARPQEEKEGDVERAEGGGGGRTIWGIPVPSVVGGMGLFPGAGRSLNGRERGEEMRQYESVAMEPTTTSGTRSSHSPPDSGFGEGRVRLDSMQEDGDRRVFDLGEEDEDEGDDKYWEEREAGRR
ncbi:hypothetical protein BCR35DRAFT_303135 [Leucosporidium creatinivorum]|uniref:Protein YTP1-like C-terminal domain-containing protein n=1 Tax=Leucosporidium creatinivorum TaxID=106004 RepID=A0A1Y2FMX8_9BASI|nr:hypothetical protein BCR35DRAFT_303135 [Leucosporidium creatinivorum]